MAVRRLSAFECMYLGLETADWPCHFGGLAILDGNALLDTNGDLRLNAIRSGLERRLARAPQLRRRLHRPGFLRGRPLWVDDERFAIENHVHEAAVTPPAGEEDLLATAARLYAPVLDRRRPLWELWFITGLADGRVAALLKLHHAIADGMAAVAVMGALFDSGPGAPQRPEPGWTPTPPPSGWLLFIDTLASVGGKLARIGSALVHPGRLVAAARLMTKVVGRSMGRHGAPSTSLNGPVRAGRRIGYVRLDRAQARREARRHRGTVNDVVLSIWSGGLRRLLLSRGDRVEGVELAAGQAVSLRRASRVRAVDNQVGTIIVPLPLWQTDADDRLAEIVRTSRRLRMRRQLPAGIAGAMTALQATPLGRWLNLHQRAANVIVTNVPGPSATVRLLGAPVLEILPIIQLIGNIGLTLCAFSYAGHVALVVSADARGFPDLDELIAGMAEEWKMLSDGARAASPTGRGQPDPQAVAGEGAANPAAVSALWYGP
ncbi:MAG TPA: wax ester/triacylglycerol synthase family O-acyltransferase [Candidatus Limnocylindria bacterium]